MKPGGKKPGGLQPMDNSSEKKMIAKKYKLVQIPQKILVKLLMST